MHGVLTHEHEVIKSCEDMNDYQGEERIVLIIPDEDSDLTIVACETINDIAYYVAQDKLIKDPDIGPDEWILLRADIQDPEDLPYEMERGNCVFVIYDDAVLFRGDTMQEAVNYIEGTFKMGWPVDISDFAVLSALELRHKIKERLVRLIGTFDELLEEGGHP